MFELRGKGLVGGRWGGVQVGMGGVRDRACDGVRLWIGCMCL